MKIECCGCKEEFEIPDGKGINRAICPFCEKPNDLRKSSFLHRSPEKDSAAQNNVQKPAKSPSAKQTHPLAPQFWIISICTLVITTIIVGYVIVDIIVSYQASKEIKAFSEWARRGQPLN